MFDKKLVVSWVRVVPCPLGLHVRMLLQAMSNRTAIQVHIPREDCQKGLEVLSLWVSLSF